MDLIFGTSELLQYFAGTVAWVDTAKTIGSSGIGTGFAAGDTIVVTDADETGNNGVKTLEVVAADLLTIEEEVTADASDAIVINQIIVGGWVRVDFYSRIVGSLYASQNANLYADWSHDGSTVDFTQTTAVSSTAAAYAQEVLAKWVRFRLYNSGADQTALSVYLYAKEKY